MAELAKIVTGRATGSTVATRRAAANDMGNTRAPAGDALNDLEAELMNDLQASFATVRDVAASPPPKPLPAAPLPVARQAAPPPPVSRQPPPPQVVAAPPLPEFDEDAYLDKEVADDTAERPSEMFTAPVFAPPGYAPQSPSSMFADVPAMRGRAAAEEQPIPRLVPTTPIMPTHAEDMPLPPAPERPSRAARAPASGEKPDLGNFQLRPTSAPPVQPAASSQSSQSRQPHSRWERPEPAKPQTASANRFAPPRGAPPTQPQSDDEDDLFGEGGLFAEAEGDANDGPFDAIGLAPGYTDDELQPPFVEDDVEKLAKRRGSRTPVLIGGLIGLVLIGGIAVAMFRPTGADTSPPPVIAANTDPTKITPDEPAVTEADQNKLSYDRINAGDANADTTLLTPGNEPIADVQDGQANNAISRVIIPGGPGIDAPPADEGLPLDGQPAALPPDGTAMAANDVGAEGEALGPRKVRTVVVKPDGTIVESVATDAGAQPTSAPAPAASVTAAAEPAPAEQPMPVTDDTAAIAGTGGNGELAITPDPQAIAAAPAPMPEQPAARAAVEPPPAPRAQAVAANDATAPIDLGQSARPAASGGMLVQVSSQRSEDAARATFRDLQARYPSILGKYDVNLQRADVPDRGTFFRVRVGPFSPGDAQRLCDDLKSAGGDCILAQR